MKSFKTIIDKEKNQYIIGYTTSIAAYGKNLNGKYRIEIPLCFDLIGKSFPLYVSKKKPKFKNLYLIGLPFIPFNILLTVFLLIITTIIFYFKGGYKLIRNNFLTTEEVIFVETNIILVISLLLLLLFN